MRLGRKKTMAEWKQLKTGDKVTTTGNNYIVPVISKKGNAKANLYLTRGGVNSEGNEQLFASFMLPRSKKGIETLFKACLKLYDTLEATEEEEEETEKPVSSSSKDNKRLQEQINGINSRFDDLMELLVKGKKGK